MALTAMREDAMREDLRNAPGSPGDLPLERIEAELTELAGHLAAGECRWLLLVAEFDRRAGWEQWGCRSCVQWLSWQCGLDGRAAREKLRVAHALDSLPVITREFAAGRLSYSKVRALTRIATAGNEAELADLAMHATAVQVERVVRGYRRAGSADDERESAERAHAERWVRIEPADDGTYEIGGRLPAEVAALVLAALDAAREQEAAGRGGRSRGTARIDRSPERRCAREDGGVVPCHRSRRPEGWRTSSGGRQRRRRRAHGRCRRRSM